MGGRFQPEQVDDLVRNTHEVQELVQLGVLKEREVMHTYPTYEYELDESALSYFQEQIDAAQQYRDLAFLIAGQDARKLELAATLLYFVRNDYSRAQAEQEVKRVKADRLFSPEEIQRAWSFLDSLRELTIRLSRQ